VANRTSFTPVTPLASYVLPNFLAQDRELLQTLALLVFLWIGGYLPDALAGNETYGMWSGETRGRWDPLVAFAVAFKPSPQLVCSGFCAAKVDVKHPDNDHRLLSASPLARVHQKAPFTDLEHLLLSKQQS
jgi:hypothetical protein